MRGGLILPLGEHGAVLARGLMPRYILFMVLVMAAVISLEFIPAARAALKFGPVLTITILACFGGYFLSYHLAARRLVNAQYRTCLKCRAPLPGTKHWGACPKCSRYYNILDIKEEFESPFSFTGPAHIPTVLRPYRAMGALGGAMMTVAMLLAVPTIDFKYSTVVFISLLVCGILIALSAFLLERRLLARIKRAAYLVCPGCLYSLENAGFRGTCLECSRPFDTDLLRRDWQRCARQWQRPE